MIVESHTLPNGLRVLLDEMPGAASCAVNLCILSGLRYESGEKTGISHMIEHMLFKGTQSRTARQIAEEADDCGANLNAYTCKEYTCLYIRSLPEHLAAMLALLADMLLHSKFSQEDLELERSVVLEEIAMYEDIPEDLVFDHFYDLVWPEHMLGKNILGTRQTLAGFASEDLHAHMAQFYRPERMVLSICGKFDQADIKARIEELFGAIPQAHSPLPHALAEPCAEHREAPAVPQAAVYHVGTRFTAKAVEQNQIVLAFPGCSGRDPKRYRASLLATMLGGSSSSRLFQRLREQLGLVYSVDYFNVHHMMEGISGVSLGLGEKTQCRALAEVLEILQGFAESVTPQELRRAQEQAAASMVMSLESNAARASRAAFNMLLYQDVCTVEDSIAAYRAVTLEEIRSDMQALVDPSQYALCVLGKFSKKAQNEMVALLGR